MKECKNCVPADLLTGEELQELEQRITTGDVIPMPDERRDYIDLVLECSGRRIIGGYHWDQDYWDYIELIY
jgi:hypothetical protein